MKKKAVMDAGLLPLLAVLAMGLFASSGRVDAAVVSLGTSTPAVGDGVENLNFSTGTSDDTDHPYVSNNYIGNGSGFAIGQTFTTGSNEAGYELTSLSACQVSWGPTSWDYSGGQVMIRVFAMASGDVGGVYNADTLLYETNSVGGAAGGLTTAGTPSSPMWLTVTFDTPLHLEPGTLYGFSLYADGTTANDGFFMEWDGTAVSMYAEGNSLTVEPIDGTVYWSGTSQSDRSFVAAMDASTVLPPFRPIRVSPEDGATEVVNPVTLSADIVKWGATFVSASMEFDGLPVSVNSSNPDGDTTTITYDAGILAANSTHTGKVVAVGTTGSMTNEWTFTVAPPLTFVSATPNAPGASPTPTLEVVIANGASQLDTNSLALYLDDVSVSIDQINANVPATNQTQITGNWLTDLDQGTTHTGKVVYAGINPAVGPYTNSWTFIVAGDPGFGIYIHDNTQPIPGADDVYQFAYSSVSSNNVSGGIDDAVYVRVNGAVPGQTFSTGSSAGSYTLTSVWVKHVEGYSNWTFFPENAQDKIRITDPSQAGTSNFVLYAEDLAVITNSGALMNGGGEITGTGNWVEYRLQTPITLDANTQYGFDIGASIGPENEYWALAGVITNAYSGGTAYSSGAGGVGTNDQIDQVGDRTFMVSLTAVGPSVTPDIQSIAVSGGSVTLMWDSESGANYGVMHKTALTDGTWTEVTNVTGTGASTTATVPAGSSEEFFKIETN